MYSEHVSTVPCTNKSDAVEFLKQCFAVARRNTDTVLTKRYYSIPEQIGLMTTALRSIFHGYTVSNLDSVIHYLCSSYNWSTIDKFKYPYVHKEVNRIGRRTCHPQIVLTAGDIMYSMSNATNDKAIINYDIDEINRSINDLDSIIDQSKDICKESDNVLAQLCVAINLENVYE